jgi:hypothetical protein
MAEHYSLRFDELGLAPLREKYARECVKSSQNIKFALNDDGRNIWGPGSNSAEIYSKDPVFSPVVRKNKIRRYAASFARPYS